MATLLMARHGEADWNRERRWLGQADRPLTRLGRTQAASLGLALQDRPIAAVFCSDLQRASETAAMAMRGWGLEVERLPSLRERSYGRWDGLHDDEIPKLFPADYEAWRSGTGDGAADAESYSALQLRVMTGRIAAVHRESTVLVVTHSGPLAVVCAAAFGIAYPRDRDAIPGVGNGGMVTVSTDGGSFRLR